MDDICQTIAAGSGWRILVFTIESDISIEDSAVTVRTDGVYDVLTWTLSRKTRARPMQVTEIGYVDGEGLPAVWQDPRAVAGWQDCGAAVLGGAVLLRSDQDPEDRDVRAMARVQAQALHQREHECWRDHQERTNGASVAVTRRGSEPIER